MTADRYVLVTGATSGIGLGLAERYGRTGASVIVAGRSPERVERAVERVPGSVGVVGDLAVPSGRELLAGAVERTFGGLDVLVNNAGVQRRVAVAVDDAPWTERQRELDLLLAAPIHLVSLLTPLLLGHGRPSLVVDVTSGGAFVPQPFAPAYSAAKAGLHSWTTNLRHAFAGTSVSVTELVPPAVATGLAGPGATHGADLDAFCDAVFPLLEEGHDEVGFGATGTAAFRARLIDERTQFEAAAARFPVTRYADRG